MVGLQRPKNAAALGAIALAALMTTAAQAITISVNSVAIQSSADLTTDNDFTRIANAIASANPTDVIELNGTFDWSEPNAYAAAAVNYGIDFNNVSDLTITGNAGAAIVQSDIDALKDKTQDRMGFLYNFANVDNVTISNIRFENLNYVIGAYGSSGNGYTTSNNNVTIDGCYFKMAPYDSHVWGNIETAIWVGTGTATGLQITNNTIELVANASRPDNPTNYLDLTHGRLILLRPSTDYANTADADPNNDVARISGNNFIASIDPAMPLELTTWAIALWDNSNRQNDNMEFHDNVIDGGVDVNGDIYRMFYTGHVVTARDGEFYNPQRTHSVSWEGNEYRNCLYAIDNAYAWDANDPEDVIILEDTVFENNGWGIEPQPDAVFRSFFNPTDRGLVAIRNLRQGTFGAIGPKKVAFVFPLEVEGETDRNALHEISELGTFFEAIEDGQGGFVDAGIYGARVEPPFGAPVTDSKYNGLRYFSQPPFAGEENEVVGYTVFGDPVVPPDPNELDNNTNDNDIIEINPGEYYELAPGSIITKNLTFRTATTKRTGAPENPGIIVPSALDFANPLFLVQAGGNLTLQNVKISANNPNISGTRNVPVGIAFDSGSPGGNLTLENVTLEGFIGPGVDMANGGTVDATSVVLADSGRGIGTANGTTLNLSDAIFTGNGVGLHVNRGTVDVKKARFVDNSVDIFSNSPSSTDFQLGGAMDMGNMFFEVPVFSFNGNAEPTGTFSFDYNWFSVLYGSDANEANGLITGDVPAFGSDEFDVTTGEFTYQVFTTATGWTVGNIVAALDSDLDAWPNVWELTDGNYEKFDSDNDGWPDGVEAAEGTDPRDGGSVPAGTFDIAADLDDNGIADWYEDAWAANVGVDVDLGDVLRNGGVGLTDAVRALQVVNGQFGTQKTQVEGDMNALDVTGLGGSSLANPLQVLRFQATVRDTLPALPGIN